MPKEMLIFIPITGIIVLIVYKLWILAPVFLYMSL